MYLVVLSSVDVSWNPVTWKEKEVVKKDGKVKGVKRGEAATVIYCMREKYIKN